MNNRLSRLGAQIAVSLLVSLLLALLIGLLLGGSAHAASAPVRQAPPGCPQTDAILREEARKYFDSLPPGEHKITSAQLKRQIEQDRPLFLLDIRPPEEFVREHVPGFTNIPFRDLGKQLGKLPRDRLIVVSCRTGQTAGQTVGVLRMAGYDAVQVEGSIQGMRQSGLFPMAKE